MRISGATFSSLAFAPALGLGSVKMTDQNKTLEINPTPKFQLSPWLYMQFMEPLGTTDSSVEAAWDHGSDRWRNDVIEATRDGGVASHPIINGKKLLARETGESQCTTFFGAAWNPIRLEPLNLLIFVNR